MWFAPDKGAWLILVAKVLPVESGLFGKSLFLVEVQLGAGNLCLGGDNSHLEIHGVDFQENIAFLEKCAVFKSGMDDLHSPGDLGGKGDQAMGPDIPLGGDKDLVILPFQFVNPGLNGLGLGAWWGFFRFFDGEFVVTGDPDEEQNDREDYSGRDPKKKR